MNSYADKTTKNKNQSVADSLSGQNKVHEKISDSAHVQQLKAYQSMADQFTSETVQQKENLEEEILQEKSEPVQKKENNTGLPDNLKAGIENLSGYAMDDVRVHYNSGRPEQLQAHAYAQGTNIHLAPGQERHLPHEAWHVVQQKQGRVKPTLQMKGGVNVNDDSGLENEADIMGDKALQMQTDASSSELSQGIHSGNVFPPDTILQAVFSQNPIPNLQNSHHGGVHSQYDTALNLIELHIGAGANQNGEMMQDFLAALWEARDTIIAGQARNPGGVFMRPGGSQVLKMTMEMLGEAIGQGPQLTAARTAKTNRGIANQPLWVDPTGNGAQNDILDQTVVPENIAYRNSMVGVAGITMNPIGGGTSGGVVDMLGVSPGAIAERALYDAALITLSPFMSIAITLNLAVLNQVISMIEGKISVFKLLYLKVKYLKDG